MRRTQLLLAIGMSLWAAVADGSKATAVGALPGTLRTHLQSERFGIVTSLRGLPLGVRDGLQRLFGSGGLDIAEPGAPFQLTDEIATPELPGRRLALAGCSNDFHCLVYYERGDSEHTWHVALFHWTPEETRFEWGGGAPRDLATIDDLRKMILAGMISGEAGTDTRRW